jgi:RHS repeat-associated protein
MQTRLGMTEFDACASRCTGKERDAESGLDYFGARYYGSNMGRFMSPDPIKITEDRLLNPANTLNLYSYAANNPLKYVDPDGQDVTYFYDQSGVAGHAVLFAYNQQTGASAIESFGPIVHSPIAAGESMFDMGIPKSADDLRSTYAALTIQTSPELAQQIIQYINSNPDPNNWMAFGPNCSTQCSKILQKFKLQMQHKYKNTGLRPKLLWNDLRQQYNPNAPAKPQNGTDYGQPRTDMFNAMWLSLPQAKDTSTVTTSQHDNGPCGGDGQAKCQ